MQAALPLTVQHQRCCMKRSGPSRHPQAPRFQAPRLGCTRTAVAAAVTRATFPEDRMPGTDLLGQLPSPVARAPMSREHAEWQSACADSKPPSRRPTIRRASQLLPGACDAPRGFDFDDPETPATYCRTCGRHAGFDVHVHCKSSNSRTFFAPPAASIHARRPHGSQVLRMDCESTS